MQQPARAETYRSWLIGELVLVTMLALATVALALADRLDGYALPQARLALDTVVAVVATIVAVLAAVRFLVEGRLLDLLLAAGFLTAALGTFAFGIAPRLGGKPLPETDAWAALAAATASAALIAIAAFTSHRISSRRRALFAATAFVLVAVLAIRVGLPVVGVDGPLVGPEDDRSPVVVLCLGSLSLLGLIAAIGFGLRFRKHGRDLDSWLTLALTLFVAADLHYVIAPTFSSEYVLQGDFLRLLAYGVLLVGVWRAISQAEFGRAVAEERARVATEIHDGLAQYLFALSTHVSMLEAGAPLDAALPRLKQASLAAQQEARFAVLALSSASGIAPFDAALRRYVDFLAADGVLEVELDIDPAVSLAPDEQIELFRIVQEGLANARKHAGARRAWVAIEQRGSRRVVVVRDDGIGFEDTVGGAGQGLRNMRRRAAAIDGGFSMHSSPGRGTSIEVVLRAV